MGAGLVVEVPGSCGGFTSIDYGYANPQWLNGFAIPEGLCGRVDTIHVTAR